MSDVPEQNFRRTMADEGDLQILAGISLISASCLRYWDTEHHKFACPDAGFFLGPWTQIDRAFGRVLLWNAFSAGAEYMLKGVVLANGREIRDDSPVEVKGYPKTDEAELTAWAARCYSEKIPRAKRVREQKEQRQRDRASKTLREPVSEPPAIPTLKLVKFGALNKLIENTGMIDEIAGLYAPAKEVDCATRLAFQSEVEIVFAAFDLL
ncbi:hypothetical protein [Caballeronia sp. M23-90]